MRRSMLVAGAIWLAALAAFVALSALDRQGVLHGYLVGWLVLVSLPLGALPALMIAELLRQPGSRDPEPAMLAPLRLMLAGLPLLALLALPILLMPGSFFGWVASSHAPGSASYHGFAARWFTPAFFAGRGIVSLVVWLALATAFVVPGRSTRVRRAIAITGLPVHLVIGTLAAFDWVMSLDPSSVSSAYGVIVISAQIALAVTVALLLSYPRGRVRYLEVVALLTTVALATYLQFSQYLVVWSANLPSEIVWYQTRWRDVVGPVFAIGAPLLLIVATALLLPEPLAMRRLPATLGLAAILVVVVFDLVCLASPGRTFTLGGVGLDCLGVIAVAGLAALCALLIDGLLVRRVRHG